MINLSRHLVQPWGRILGGLSCRIHEIPKGITQICLSSRITRINDMQVSVYAVGNVLIDAGFVHARAPLMRILSGIQLRAICLTHHHEDHCGISGTLAAIHGCPIYLRNISARFSEGVMPYKPYRLIWWGEPDHYDPIEMPEKIETDDRTLWVVPTSGHSSTHSAFFDEQNGDVFIGDLFMSKGVSAVMSHENPFESIQSLRRIAEFQPHRMFTGHGFVIENPAKLLKEKAGSMEQSAEKIVQLHDSGLSDRAIVSRIFTNGYLKDKAIEILTGGEFSRINFIRACIRFSNNKI